MKKHLKRCITCLLLTALLFLSATFCVGYRRYVSIRSNESMTLTIQAIQDDASYTPLNAISKDFINAILAVEDPHFYTHKGIRIAKIVEAVITDIIHLNYVMGGSTITQQLAKNLFLDQDKNLSRKVAELFFVRDLESALTKDEILTLYLNIIYFGDGYYGIQDAAQGYFHKNADELTLDEATLLAGLPQAPAVLQLSDGYEAARKRQLEVLDAMLKQALITQEQADIIKYQSDTSEINT